MKNCRQSSKIDLGDNCDWIESHLTVEMGSEVVNGMIWFNTGSKTTFSKNGKEITAEESPFEVVNRGEGKIALVLKEGRNV